LFEQAESEINIDTSKKEQILSDLEKELLELQEHTKFSLKNMLPVKLKNEFENDKNRINKLRMKSIREPISLEEIYRTEREREGTVIIPPQINGEFKEAIDKLADNIEINLLLNEFLKYKELAEKNPGQTVEGNVILGAPDFEYFQPSEESKRLSYVGESIAKIIESISSEDAIKIIIEKLLTSSYLPVYLKYNFITFHHVDVVGSGRFIYPNLPVERDVYITKILTEKLVKLKGDKIDNQDYLLSTCNNVSDEQNKDFLNKLLRLLIFK